MSTTQTATDPSGGWVPVTTDHSYKKKTTPLMRSEDTSDKHMPTRFDQIPIDDTRRTTRQNNNPTFEEIKTGTSPILEQLSREDNYLAVRVSHERPGSLELIL